MSRKPTKADLENRINELVLELSSVKEAARQTEERYQSLFAHSSELLYIHDLQGRFLEANDSALKLLGYSREEIPGVNLSTIVIPEDLPKALGLLEHLTTIGLPETPKYLDFRLKHKGGSIIWVEASSSIVYRDGRAYAIQGIARDITERKLTEEKLRLSEEKHRSVLENIEEGYYEMDLKGRVTFFNAVAGGMLGYEPQELASIDYRGYTSKETAGRLYAVFHRIYETGIPERLLDYEVICKDGSTRVHELSAGLMRDPQGKPSGFNVLVHDITSRKKAEDRLKKSEEHYRTIFENTGNATILIAEDTTILLANSNFEKLTGYSKDELEGKMSWVVFVAPEDMERMKGYHVKRRLDPSSVPKSYEFRLKSRSGELRDIYLTIAMIPGTNRSVASCMDITERKRSEEELRRSEERYRNILESMEEAYYEVDLKGNFTFFNSKAGKALGMSDEDLKGINFQKYTDEANAKKVFDAYHQVYITGVPITGLGWEVFTKDGRKLFVEASVALIKNELGAPVGFRGLVRDINERKKAEDALRASEEKYRGILESMQEAYFEVDLAGNFTFFNDASIKMSGYSREELLGMNYLHYAPPETAKRMFETFHDVYVSGMAQQMVDYQVIHKNGSFHDNELSVWPMKDSSGNIIGFHTLVRDVTARMKVEKALKENEERYRAIFENTGSASVLIARDTTILLANTNFARLTGYTKDEIEGRMSWTSFVDERDLERMKRYHEQRRIDSVTAPQAYEFRMKTRSGEIRDIFQTISMIPGTTESVSSCIDITERNLAEEAVRESEKKYRLLAENLRDVIWVLDKDLKYVYVSPSVIQLRGFTPEEAMKQTMEQVLAPSSYQMTVELFAREKLLELSGRRHGREWTRNIDLEMIRKDGTTVWTEVTLNILYDEEGAPTGLLGITHDISERRKAAETLRESEERWLFALEGAGDGVWDYDIPSGRVFRSRRWKEMLGYTEEEISDSVDEWTRLVHPDDLKISEECLNSHLRGETPVYVSEHRIRCKDGSYKWILDRGKVMRWSDDGKALRIIGTQSDVTDRKHAEEALMSSEERYRSLVDGMIDGVYRSTHDGQFVDINNAMVEMFGYASKEEMMLVDIIKELYFLPEDRESQALRDMQGGKEVHCMRRRDGSAIWVEDHARYVYDDHGNIIFHEGTLRDVTERKRSEEALKKSEEFYRTIFENTGNASMLLDKDTTILLVNSNFEKLSGYKRQEIENKMSWTVFVSPDDLARMRRYHELRRKEGGVAPDSYEFTFIDRNGQPREVFLSIALIPGTMISVASLMDISERKKAEQALRESEERFRDLARLLPETVFETDEKGMFTFVNQISLDRFGYTQEEVDKGLSVLDVIAPEDHERVIMNYNRVIKGELIGLNEYYAKKRNGSIFPALIHTTVIYRDGRPAGLRGFLIDVTEKKNLEDQLFRAQKLEAVGTLAGGIAHDFNNLLMGILGNVSLMLMHFEESHPFYDRLKSMEEYVQRGSDLTKQLLGFARGGKYEVKPTNLGDFVRKSSELFGRTKKEIRIHHKIADMLWSVEVDRGQMEQVMLNLFVNAWQAMPGGGDLYLSVENINLDEMEVRPQGINPGKFVKVTVTDTGVGMDETVKDRIFEPFFTTKERGRGTGLGLASVYGIIKNHGGFIHVESEKDFGTSFMIFIPASDKEVSEELKKVDEIRKGQETVLLIDDEEMILEVGTSMLEGLGYKVITATGGRQGLKMYEQHRDAVKLVILDMIMPDFGGKETFDTLRRVNPEVKVLLSSGYSLDGQAKDIMKSGCRGFIQKPFTMVDLSKKIREILDSE